MRTPIDRQEHVSKSHQEDGDSYLKWVVILMSVGTGIAADQFAPGWGRSALITIIVFGGIVGIWQQLWGHLWFWGTVVLLFVAHSLILLSHERVRAFLERIDPFTAFTIAFLEIMLVAAVLAIFISLKDIEF